MLGIILSLLVTLAALSFAFHTDAPSEPISAWKLSKRPSKDHGDTRDPAAEKARENQSNASEF
jgi:hypothetical protein